MKIEIEQTELLGVISRMAAVADRRSLNPIIGCVLIDVSDISTVARCLFTATDTSLTIIETVECEVSGSGSVAIPVHHLRNVVATLSGKVTIETLDNSWVRVRAGRSDFKLMAHPGADFPEMPSMGDVGPCDAAPLAELIDKTAFSVSTDEARINLNGALLLLDPKTATMVSTDGHRLTKHKVSIYHDVQGWPLKGEVISNKGLSEIAKLLKRVERVMVGVQGVHMFVRSGATTLTIRLNRTTFPPWGQVMPKSHDRSMTVDRKSMIEALSQALVIAPEKTATIKLEYRGEGETAIELMADNPERGAIRIDVEADMQGSSMTSGFNGAYLRDALSVLSDERVRIDFQGELDPCLIRRVDDDAFQAIVMPMRI